MARKTATDSRELALFAAQLVLDKKGQDVRLLEVGRISIVADYFLLATGATAVQVHAICDHLVENMKKKNYYALRIEGYREGWWIVLDYGGLVVHLFQPEARTFYNLERLWSEAPPVKIETAEKSLP